MGTNTTAANTCVTLETPLEELAFSRSRCLRFDGGEEDLRCVRVLAGHLLSNPGGVALFGAGRLCDYLLAQAPELKSRVKVILDDDACNAGRSIEGIPVVAPGELPDGIAAAFLCSTNWRALRRMRQSLPKHVESVTLDALLELDWAAVPASAWLPKRDGIYPIDVPEIEFLPDQELILLDFPARSLAQLPVGLGYVHDALKREGIRFQTVDTDIVIYHRYHGDRLMDGVPDPRTSAGDPMPEDPWQPVHYLEWEKAEVLDYFDADIRQIADKLIAARPKIIACSIQQASLQFAKRVLARVRDGAPEIVLLVGGMSCLQPGAAKTIFPLADYTVVGEADLTIGPLVRAVLRGEKVADMPGVWSRYDAPDRAFTPGEIPRDLAPLGHPRFEWTRIDLYRNWNGYRLTPIVGSRGCGWGRCRFCAEGFTWRPRPPKQVADDIEFFNQHGCDDFVFNESDLHWKPELTEELCDEIIRRGLKIRMTAQLRCNGRVGKEYFRKLSQAGFGCLRFGIDGWSDNALKIQRKGYTKQMILNNLRDATVAGIFTEANCVIGVPGETDEDIEESIGFLKQLKPYIGRVPFVNPLMLFRGSEFWNTPEEFNIVFHSDKDQLYTKYPVAIPESEWHSESPYIDAGVRCRRFRRFVTALRELEVPTTAWTDFTADEVTRNEGELSSNLNPSANSAAHSDTVAEPAEYVSNSPEIVETYASYDIVRFDRMHYACPRSLGRVDFRDPRSRTREGVLLGETVGQVKRVIRAVRGTSDEAYLVTRQGDRFVGVQARGAKIRLRDPASEPLRSAGRNPSSEQPPISRLAASVRPSLSVLYQSYLRAPLFVRAVLDRPVFLLKRVVALVFRRRF